MQVNVGVRPEDFTETNGDDYIFEGEVDIVEALGEVTQLYFKPQKGSEPIIGKLTGIHSGLRGKTVKLTAITSKVQVFHQGKSLYYR